jgi:hypothetical protein
MISPTFGGTERLRRSLPDDRGFTVPTGLTYGRLCTLFYDLLQHGAGVNRVDLVKLLNSPVLVMKEPSYLVAPGHGLLLGGKVPSTNTAHGPGLMDELVKDSLYEL